MGRHVAFADKIEAGVELADTRRQVENGPAVVIAQLRIGLQLAQENFERVRILDRLAPAGIGREREASLSRQEPGVGPAMATL